MPLVTWTGPPSTLDAIYLGYAADLVPNETTIDLPADVIGDSPYFWPTSEGIEGIAAPRAATSRKSGDG